MKEIEDQWGARQIWGKIRVSEEANHYGNVTSPWKLQTKENFNQLLNFHTITTILNIYKTDYNYSNLFPNNWTFWYSWSGGVETSLSQQEQNIYIFLRSNFCQAEAASWHFWQDGVRRCRRTLTLQWPFIRCSSLRASGRAKSDSVSSSFIIYQCADIVLGCCR